MYLDTHIQIHLQVKKMDVVRFVSVYLIYMYTMYIYTCMPCIPHTWNSYLTVTTP